MKSRQAAIKRVTKETRISLKLNIDGNGKSSIKTGIPFFDHMLTLFAKHAVMDLTLRCDGDLEVDAVGLAIGSRVSADDAIHAAALGGLQGNGRTAC